jgi:ABC-type multidrug transport system ATPase subunit/energy-coupling factor transporter ATP-binding protein EcfA2
MKLTFKGQYKSLSTFEWETHANLVIITGQNGSGKTQLLELLQLALAPNFPQDDIYQHSEANPLTGQNEIKRYYIKLEDVPLNYTDYINWNSLGKHIPSTPIDYGYYEGFINWIYIATKPEDQGLYQKLNLHSTGDFVPTHSHGSGFESLVNGYHLRDKIITLVCAKVNKSKEELEITDLLCHLPINDIFNAANFNSTELIDYFVFFYYMQKLRREIYGIETESLGKDPIVVLNEILKGCGLKYDILPFDYERYEKAKGVDSTLKVIMPFTLLAKKQNSDALIHFQNFSWGERVIVSLGFLEYYASYMKRSPSVMILDEIDAHLHPALLPNFYRVVNDILIKQFKTKVIMTTHSPSTIALAPKDDDCIVYKMTNEGKTELIPDTSKNHYDSINLLTEGLIIVNEKTKYVFVEDEDDVDFYTNFNTVNTISNRLVFLSASNRTKDENGKTEVNKSGGKNAVNSLTNKFEALQGVFEGLIDRDSGNEKLAENLNLVERYSLENYYLDPLVLFILLNNAKTRKPEIVALDVPLGKEHELSEEKAKLVIDCIVAALEPEVINQIEKDLKANSFKYAKPITDANSSKTKVKVEFVNGKTFEFPEWLLYYRGKTIATIFGQVFGIQLNNGHLLQHYNRIGNYPKELVEKLKMLL